MNLYDGGNTMCQEYWVYKEKIIKRNELTFSSDY